MSININTINKIKISTINLKSILSDAGKKR